MARLTKAQRSINDAIIETLGKAGWQTTDRGSAFGIADLTYENDRMELYVGYRHRSSTIGLDLEDPSDGREIRFSIGFGDRLEELLRVIVSWQAKVTPRNFRDMIEGVVHVCPETYLVEGTEGEVRTKVEPTHPSAPAP